MKFYKSIAEFYDLIFPLKKEQVNFITSYEIKNLLDIGSATGNLPIELAKKNINVIGLEYDSEMIKISEKKKKNRLNPIFIHGDMKKILSYNLNKKFDAISCFGNTLVHLNKINEIKNFFMDCNKLLNDNGKFFLQIINYDRIIDNKINFLPLIENNNIRFERYYTYLKTEKLITFSTKLFLKTQKNKLIQNSISLIPLRKNILSNLLKNTGFTISNYFSNFKKTSFQNNSIPLILTATKS